MEISQRLYEVQDIAVRSGIASCSSACYNFAHGIADLHGEL